MSEFDLKAKAWDSNPMHVARSAAVAEHIMKLIPVNRNMKALEFGAGTGMTSMHLSDKLQHITMMDNSQGMVDIMEEKIRNGKIVNLSAVRFDLEKEDYKDGKFDLIFTQMVLHHVSDTGRIIKKFADLLNKGGYIAIADVYSEDGSFHGTGFNGHKGFDPEDLSKLLNRNGFYNTTHMPCFTIEKAIEDGTMKKFDVFILTAQYMPV
ncbi:MAG TPA: class I SAM-dependent methyltransferase [Bacteroidales bacterium]|nr:class I SAM-dependent methyltransferase [Bacteroidales bacterium]